MAVPWKCPFRFQRRFLQLCLIANNAETSFVVYKSIVRTLIESMGFSQTSFSHSVSNGSGLPSCCPGLEPHRMVGSSSLPGKQGYPAILGTGSNRTAVAFYGSYNVGSNWVFEFPPYRNMIYTWNVQIDALVHLPFLDLRSDQYLLSRFEIELNITPTGPGFHRDSTTIDPISNRTMGDGRRHQTAYFTYRLCRDTIRTPIHNCSKKCGLLRSRFCVETLLQWSGSGSAWDPELNREFGPVANTTLMGWIMIPECAQGD